MRLLALCLALLVCAPAFAGLNDDMAAFERTYIPALALTNQPQADADRVQASVERLAAAMPRFAAAIGPAAPELDRAVREAQRAVLDAQDALEKGKRAQAHEALERIRPAFMKARGLLHIDFYPDRLTEFHEAMEAVVKLAASGATPVQIRGPLAQASGLWANAEGLRFPPRLFGFDDAKLAKLRELVGAERAILERMRVAVDANDRGAIEDAAPKLKATFSQIYTLFGDFGDL